jgi:hypothetical protein
MKNFNLTRENTFEDIEKIFSDTDVDTIFETNDFGLILFHRIIETWVENLGDWVTRKKELKEPAEEVEQQYAKYILHTGTSLTLLVNPNFKDTSEKDYAEYIYLNN